MIIGIVGSRRRDKNSDYLLTKECFYSIYKEGDWICSGGCSKGGDRFAERIAKQDGIPILTFYPDWNQNGQSAGFTRNTEIAEKSDILIACVSKDRTGGTEDTIKKYLKFNRKDYRLYLVLEDKIEYFKGDIDGF